MDAISAVKPSADKLILPPLFRAAIQSLPGIGPKVAEALARLRIGVAGDLLWHFPTHIERKLVLAEMAAAKDGMQVLVKLRISEIEHPKQYSPRSRISLRITGTLPGGEIFLEFFHTPPAYILQSVRIGSDWWVRGALQFYNGYWSIKHPQFSHQPPAISSDYSEEVVYPLTYTINNSQLTKYIHYMLDRLPTVAEWLPGAIITQQQLLPWSESMRMCHAVEGLRSALPRQHICYQRIAYDEAFCQQLSLQLVRRYQNKVAGKAHDIAHALLASYYQSLPFTLTNAQQRVIGEIQADQAAALRMMRLIQGDVGSGKTVVAVAAMLSVAASGGQAALMAPTDLLARQHYQTISTQLAKVLPQIKVGLLVSKLSKAERQEVLAQLQSGELAIIVGTHALFQSEVIYHDLGLIVIDEQHRFGVRQRLALAAKANHPVDTLVMTATPIPRSLTLAIYGDMDCSRIDEKPANRIPIVTRVVNKERLGDLLASLQHKLAAAEQIYWVCPLIDNTPEDAAQSDLDITAVQERFDFLKSQLACQIVVVHGKQKPAERAEAMQAFVSGAAQVMVATTVIEVGIDVPAATTIIIEHAERFGLAQLHQLRGRVGRGAQASHCILLYAHPLSAIAKMRLEAMRSSEDGFFIAEEDLRLRGGGDLLGTKQSGLPDYRVLDPTTQGDILLCAAHYAEELLKTDPKLNSEQGHNCRLALELYGYQDAMLYVQSG